VETVLPAAGMLLVAFTVGFGVRAALSEARRRQARNERKTFGPIDAEPSPAAMRAERDVLAREVRQLGEHVDRLLGLLEREQALRHHLQDELARAIERPFVLLDEARAESAALQRRLTSTERRYRELKRVVAQLLRRLRSQGHFAEAA
jgi:predicted  nucleic acid-binding Zn-ribbon protein